MVAKESKNQNAQQGDAFNKPRKKEQFSNAIDMFGLKSDVRRFADVGKERIVDDVDGPDESNHEKCRGQVGDQKRASVSLYSSHGERVTTFCDGVTHVERWVDELRGPLSWVWCETSITSIDGVGVGVSVNI